MVDVVVFGGDARCCGCSWQSAMEVVSGDGRVVVLINSGDGSSEDSRCGGCR